MNIHCGQYIINDLFLTQNNRYTKGILGALVLLTRTFQDNSKTWKSDILAFPISLMLGRNQTFYLTVSLEDGKEVGVVMTAWSGSTAGASQSVSGWSNHCSLQLSHQMYTAILSQGLECPLLDV